MGARTDLADALRADAVAAGFTKWTVQDKPPAPSTVIGSGRRLVCVMRTSVGSQPSVFSGFANHLDVWLLTGEEDYAAAEDALEPDLTALVGMLEAIQLGGDIERGLFAESWHGYKVPVITYTTTP